MQSVQPCLKPSAAGFQPDWRLNPEAVSWLWCRGGLGFGLVLLGYFSGAGQEPCSHVGLATNKQLFFAEQLELERGGESLPARSLVSRAASVRCEAVVMPAGSTASEGCRRQHSKPLLPSLPVLICKAGECFPSPRLCSSHPPLQPSLADAARGKPRPYKISIGQHCWNPEGSGEAAVGAACLGAGIASLIANTLTEK